MGNSLMMLEKFHTETVQNVDSQASQLIASCLNNHIILTELFEQFSNSELLELSLVNKLWNYEARTVLKKRGNLMALLGCDSDYQCQQKFQDFGAHCQQMNVVPYSGLDIVICPADHTSRSPLDLTETFLAWLPLKHLTVMVLEKRWYCKDCSALRVLKKLLKDSDRILEQLTLDIEKERLKFIRHFVRDCSFPALRVLKLGEYYDTSEETYTSYMKALISRAPNLQELHVSGQLNLTVNVLEGSEAVLMYPHAVYAPFDDISENIAHALQLEKMVLEYLNPEFNFKRFSRITHVLLQASRRSLRSMKIDAVFAVPLMCYGICFENVDHRLVMAIPNNQLEQVEKRILSIVKHFDFTRIFPRVNKVEIICRRAAPEFSPDHLNAIIRQADATLGEPMPHRAANIKELYIDSSHFSNATVPFYAEMFPNIKKLEIETVGKEVTPFGFIWTHWMDLEQLDIYNEKITPNAANLDSVFCGIFPAEVAELRQKDEEYLKRVNIVPVMPAITCVRGLKTLSLNYRGCKDEPFVDDGTFVFSKVGVLIAIARCPAIAFSLHITSFSDPPAMTYLKPYMSVKSDLLDEDY